MDNKPFKTEAFFLSFPHLLKCGFLSHLPMLVFITDFEKQDQEKLISLCLCKFNENTEKKKEPRLKEAYF